MAELKSAVFAVLEAAGNPGVRNADIGRALGIYTGHEKHEGHISRMLLAIMEAEGVSIQDPDTKLWQLTEFSRLKMDFNAPRLSALFRPTPADAGMR